MTNKQLQNQTRETLRVLTMGTMLAMNIPKPAYNNLKKTLRTLIKKQKP